MSGNDKDNDVIVPPESAASTAAGIHDLRQNADHHDKERPPSVLKLVIPAPNEVSREGLTSVSSGTAPSASSSVNTSPDSISSHSHSVLSDMDPTTPIKTERKRTYSAHELHTWDNGNGPPSFNRSATITTTTDRKNSLQATTGPPSFLNSNGSNTSSAAANFQVEIASVSLPPEGIKEVEDEKNSHTVFTLEVRLTNGLRWAIEKRYSDFREFHDRMKKANNTVRNMHFPKKQYFRSKTQSVIEQRRMELEKYIREILAVQPVLKMPIFSFLAVYAHLDSYDRKKRRQQKEVDMKRMKNLLSDEEIQDVQSSFQRLCAATGSISKTTKPDPDAPSSPKGAVSNVSTSTTPASSPAPPASSTVVSTDENPQSSITISKTAFRRDVLSVFPDMPSTFAMRFMTGFSDKQNNEISMDEFLRGVAILRHGSKEDQLLFAFQMCDHDHLGKLQSTGLGNLLVALYGRSVIDKPEYKRLLNELFDYGRQRLTAEDFLTAILKQPDDQIALVLDWMPPFMQILCESASPSLLELQEDYNPLVQQKILEKETSFQAQDISILQDAFLNYRASGANPTTTTSVSTSNLSTASNPSVSTVTAPSLDSANMIDMEALSSDFPLEMSDARLTTIFSSFGPRANGVDIDIFSFVHALNIACRGTTEEKIQFGFKVFASTPNQMTRDDVFAMLQLEVLLHTPMENYINGFFKDQEIQTSAKIGLFVDLILRQYGSDSTPTESANPTEASWTYEQFKAWSTARDYQVAALDIMKQVVFVDFGVIPMNKKEEVEIAKLCYHPYNPHQLVEGDNWYIIEPSWFDHWRKYIEFVPVPEVHSNPKPTKSASPVKAVVASPEKKKESTGAFSSLMKPRTTPSIMNAPAPNSAGSPGTSTSNASGSANSSATKANEKEDIVDTDNKIIRPKYIGNMSLLKDKVFQPTDEMQAGKHFIVVCEPLWIALKSWYGGGPEIKKTVILLNDGRTTLNLWNTEHDPVSDSVHGADGSKHHDQSHHNALVSGAGTNALVSSGSSSSLYKRVRPGGSLGLVNLGNTCYMNSALQCIVNTPLFVDYFLSGMYMDDINRTSTLGMQGKLAEAYGKLSEDLWSTKFKHVSPREFKKTIGKFNEAFRGNDQQDAQELIAFLLSGLSEDLNRIHDKPYIQQPDSDGRYDSDLADEWWRNHLKREVSIVVALFTGQYKSLLTCSACGFKSARFEPFTFLQVPLPEPTHTNISIPLVFSNGHMPHKLSLRLNIDATIMDLKKEIADVCVKDFNLEHVTVADIKICEYGGSLIVGYKADNRKLAQIRSIDRMIAFQLEPLTPRVVEVTRFRRPSLIPYTENIADESSSRTLSNPTVLQCNALVEVQSKGEWIPGTIVEIHQDVATIQYRNGDIEENVMRSRIKPRPPRLLYCSVLSRKLGYSPVYFKNPFRPTPFGMPDLVRFCPELTTGVELYRMVYERVKRFVKKEMASPTPHHISGPVQHIDQVFCHEGRRPFLLRRVESKGLTDARTPWLLRSFGYTIPCNDQYVDLLEDESIAIDWDVKVLQDDVDMEKMKAIETHASVAKNDALDHGPVPLSHCLDAFSHEEKIDETYCSSCREHQEMTKKLEIWRLPPVMVIQLKRFQYTQTYRRKLGTLVQFPIHGLNLASCVAPFEEFPTKYPEKQKPDPVAEEVQNPVKETSPNGATSTPTEEQTPPANINRARRGYTNTNLEQSRCLETHYDMYGVVNHQGALGGGHYTAYAKNIVDGNWYCYDDERVRLIEESKVVTASAYLCFYVRKDMADITVDAVYPPKKDGKITEEDIDRFVEESDKGKCVVM